MRGLKLVKIRVFKVFKVEINLKLIGIGKF